MLNFLPNRGYWTVRSNPKTQIVSPRILCPRPSARQSPGLPKTDGFRQASFQQPSTFDSNYITSSHPNARPVEFASTATPPIRRPHHTPCRSSDRQRTSPPHSACKRVTLDYLNSTAERIAQKPLAILLSQPSTFSVLGGPIDAEKRKC